METYLVTAAFILLFVSLSAFMYFNENRARASRESEDIKSLRYTVESLKAITTGLNNHINEVRDKQVDRNSEFYELFNDHVGKMAIIKSDVERLNQKLDQSELQINQLLSFRKQFINSLQEQVSSLAIAPTKRE